MTCKHCGIETSEIWYGPTRRVVLSDGGCKRCYDTAKEKLDAADDEHSQLIDNLTSQQEDLLKEAHAKEYMGTDDDMPDAFEAWLEDLSLDELKTILK